MSEETGAEAPVIPVAEAVAPEVEKVEEVQQETQEAEEEEKPVWSQKEMDRRIKKAKENTAYRVRKETEAEFYKNLALQQQKQEAPAPQVDAEPSRENFDSYEDYSKALARHEARQEFSRLEAEKAARTTKEARATEAQRKQADFQARLEAGKAKIPGFEEAIRNSDVLVPHALYENIVDASDEPAALFHHFTQHPGEVERIASLSPARQIKAIAALEVQLASPARTTRAPAPIKPVGSGSAGKPLASMSMDEYAAYRRAQG